MPISGHGLDNKCPEISSKAAYRHMVEIVTDSGSSPLLHEAFGGPAAEGRNRFCPIPSHRLVFSTRPIGHAPHNFQHFLDATLGFMRDHAPHPLKGFRSQADSFRKLHLRHSEPLCHVVDNDQSAIINEPSNQPPSPDGFCFGLVHPIGCFRRSAMVSPACDLSGIFAPHFLHRFRTPATLAALSRLGSCLDLPHWPAPLSDLSVVFYGKFRR